MKPMIKRVAMGLTLLVSSSIFAATVSEAAPVMDKDGAFVHMDVAKVISDTSSGNPCGVDKAKMLYLNHQGVEHELDYRVMGECPEQN